jgi:DnaJ-class molecular chaperone
MDSAKVYKDYYYILGVTPEATTQEISEAYNELYERFGPHVNISGQDPEAMLKAFKDICEAYEVLMDPGRRQEYDRTNQTALHKTHLRQLWGKMTGSNGASVPTQGQAEETRMETEVTLREAIKGTERTFRIDEQLPCRACISLKPVQRLKCYHCRGTGHTFHSREEEVQLPAGMYDRMELRVREAGRFDPRVARNGDLMIVVKLRAHPFFTVMGRDLTCTVPVTMLEAVLGADIEVPTATGKVIMKLQPLTQTGRLYRLKGMGLAGADLLVTVQVVLPTQISAEEVELFRKLKSVSTMRNPRDEIFQKLSELNKQSETD